ncbi:MAG: hypothetical protein WC178_01035 [Candidatus Paceibacterota bacterium]
MKNEKIESIKDAFIAFRKKMTDILKSQLILFDKIDKTISEEKTEEIRKKINNN